MKVYRVYTTYHDSSESGYNGEWGTITAETNTGDEFELSCKDDSDKYRFETPMNVTYIDINEETTGCGIGADLARFISLYYKHELPA